MLSKKNKSTVARVFRQLLLGSIAFGTLSAVSSTVFAQHCDEPGCRCGQSHHGHSSDCRATTFIDRVDSIADRFESGLDRILGRSLPKKQHCQCARCQGNVRAMPTFESPVSEPYIVEPITEADEPGIADPLPSDVIQPGNGSVSLPSNNRRPLQKVPPTPPPISDAKREFPTSTEQSGRTRPQSTQSGIRSTTPRIELRDTESAMPPATRQERQPGVPVPEWLDDPFQDDQSRRQPIHPQRLPRPESAVPPGEIRWTKRPTAEVQSSKVNQPKTEAIVAKPQPEPVLRLNIAPAITERVGTKSASAVRVTTEPVTTERITTERNSTERAGGHISDSSSGEVVKATVNQPIRITFPVKK
jgi:hypothetical protein